MAFSFEMPHILMSIVLYYTIIVFQALLIVTLIYHNLLPYNGRLYICATSYVSRMQKNMISFVFSWCIVVSLVTNLKMK